MEERERGREGWRGVRLMPFSFVSFFILFMHTCSFFHELSGLRRLRLRRNVGNRTPNSAFFQPIPLISELEDHKVEAYLANKNENAEKDRKTFEKLTAPLQLKIQELESENQRLKADASTSSQTPEEIRDYMNEQYRQVNKLLTELKRRKSASNSSQPSSNNQTQPVPIVISDRAPQSPSQSLSSSSSPRSRETSGDKIDNERKRASSDDSLTCDEKRKKYKKEYYDALNQWEEMLKDPRSLRSFVKNSS